VESLLHSLPTPSLRTDDFISPKLLLGGRGLYSAGRAGARADVEDGCNYGLSRAARSLPTCQGGPV